MINSVNMSSESVNLLQRRGLSEQQVSEFSALLDKSQAQQQADVSARQVLADMSQYELKLLQKATNLVEPIGVNSLSQEGAINLLAQPDRTGMVDLNNDGVVEVGAARTISFPPVNAPESVHKAWEQATEGLSFQDKAFLEFSMHHSVYGFEINGQSTKQALSPEQQWSKEGVEQLIATGRAGIEFDVNLNGWTRWNILQQAFFDKFEKAIGNEMTDDFV